MPKLLRISLTKAQKNELEHLRDHFPKPYMRERACAILKIASGMSGRQVAYQGLFKKRRKDTIYEWVHRYQEAGVAGLEIRSGRGRKPAFSPCISR